MTLYHNKYRIETIRLKGWDYSSDGSYFVTICTLDRYHLFGHIDNEQMVLNQFGTIVNQCWFDLPNHYWNMRLDAFVIMPHHVHGIVVIDNKQTNIIDNKRTNGNIGASVETGLVETGLKPVSTHHGLFEFIRAFKTFSARRINELRNSPGVPVWQSRFHDHVIRNEGELCRIRQYIIDNPQNWKLENSSDNQLLM